LHLEIQRERMLIGMIDLDATFKITGTADAGEGRDGG
jgi:hypothetical protein